MKKKLPLILGLLIVGALGVFLWSRQAGPGPNMLGGKKPTNFVELMAMGKDYTCTFSNSDEEGNVTSGTVYIADGGKKFHGSFETQQEDGITAQSYILQDGEYSYFWSSEMKEGYKMKIDPEDNQLWPEANDGQAEQASFDENEPMDFDCQPWRPDNSKFVLPSNIEFIDFAAQMETFEEMMPEQSDSATEGDLDLDCSVCDQIPAGDAQTQCLNSLGC
ncbi:MAG: hypothetical protein ABII10_02030 [Candidatus Paceibacterota bacterium]